MRKEEEVVGETERAGGTGMVKTGGQP